MSSTHGVATRRTRKTLAGVAAVGVTASLLAVAGSSPANAVVSPGANPDLGQACGMDVVLLLDESNSMAPAAAQVRTAADGMLDAFQDTNSRVAVIKFTKTATVTAPLTFDTVSTNNSGVLGAAVASYAPTAIGGQTNWDDAFTKANALFDGRAVPKLIILVGDGQPNIYNLPDGTPSAQVPNGDAAALDPAVTQANTFKTGGGHVLGVLLGNVLPSGVANVSRVSQKYYGSPQYTSTIDYTANDGTTWTNDANGALHGAPPATADATNSIGATSAFDASTTDFVVKPSTLDLTANLKSLAQFTCSKSLTVTQRGNTPNIPADHNGNPGAGFGVAVSNMTANPVWTVPAGASGSSASTSSDLSGTSVFQWTDAAAQTPTIAVTMKPLYTFNSVACTIGDGVTSSAATVSNISTVGSVTTFDLDSAISGTLRANCQVNSTYTGKFTTFLTLKPLAATIGYGGAVTLSGLVRKPLANVKGVYPPIAGARVTIQTRPLWATTAAWTTIARTSTTAKGTFAYVVKKPYTTYNRAFRVIVSGSTTQLSANKIAAIKVAPIVTATLARTSTRIVVAGVVVPSYKGKAIYLQKYVGGKFVTIATKTISSTSRYSFTIVRPAKAAYYRTLVMPTTSRAIAVSRRLVG